MEGRTGGRTGGADGRADGTKNGRAEQHKGGGMDGRAEGRTRGQPDGERGTYVDIAFLPRGLIKKIGNNVELGFYLDEQACRIGNKSFGRKPFVVSIVNGSAELGSFMRVLANLPARS